MLASAEPEPEVIWTSFTADCSFFLALRVRRWASRISFSNMSLFRAIGP